SSTVTPPGGRPWPATRPSRWGSSASRRWTAGSRRGRTPGCPSPRARRSHREGGGLESMKVGIFLTNQNPVGADMVSALEEQYVMTRLARDRGWDAVATGQHYLSEGTSQL